MPSVYKFLTEHDLDPVKKAILAHSVPDDISKIHQNFNFIAEDGEEEIGKLALLLTIISKRKLITFTNILAVFRVENFSYVLDSIEDDELTQEQFDEIINEEPEPIYTDGFLTPIRIEITNMLDNIGLATPEILDRVNSSNYQEYLLHALQLFAEDDDVDIDTVFKITDMLRESPELLNALNKIYAKLEISKIMAIANEMTSVSEKCEKLLTYTKSLNGSLTSLLSKQSLFNEFSDSDNNQEQSSLFPQI